MLNKLKNRPDIIIACAIFFIVIVFSVMKALEDTKESKLNSAGIEVVRQK